MSNWMSDILDSIENVVGGVTDAAGDVYSQWLDASQSEAQLELMTRDLKTRKEPQFKNDPQKNGIDTKTILLVGGLALGAVFLLGRK